MFIPKDLTNKIIEGTYPLMVRLIHLLLYLKKRYLLLKYGKFKGLVNIEGHKEFDIAKNALDGSLKKDGLSLIARLKNGDDFLEVCIEKILPEIDELILLVDMNGDDDTYEVCKQMFKRYPEKVKLYEYPFDVYNASNPKYKNTPNSSLHSLSYFYNYCLSKVTYKYVMKFDDDMLVVLDNFKEIIKNHKKYKNQYLLIPQINILKRDNDYFIPNQGSFSGIAGLFGDHGIFPVSNNTYFVNDINCETFLFKNRISFCNKIGFLHLKLLKRNLGLVNYSSEFIGSVHNKKMTEGNNFIKLPKEYRKYLERLN